MAGKRTARWIFVSMLCSGSVCLAGGPQLELDKHKAPEVNSMPAIPPQTDPECADASCCPVGFPVLLGDDADNTLEGGAADECLVGLAGDDELDGGSGGDLLTGGLGRDTLAGGNGADALRGNSGDDILLGGNSGDEILGGPGDDVLDGGTAKDTLVGGPGRDTLLGDEGKDTFLIYDVCEVVAGEKIHGGNSPDTLVAPLSAGALAALGLQLTSVEIVVVDPTHSALSECGACNCEVIDDEIVCCSGHGTCNLLGDVIDADVPACTCEPGWTGPDCSIECLGGTDCIAEIFYHPTGTANGVLMRGGPLYPATTEAETTAGLKQWVVAHAEVIGIDPLDDASVLALTPDGDFRAFGGLRTLRHRQTYRGYEIIGPETQVTVTVAPPHGAISFMGTVLDPRVDYVGLDDPLSIPEATQFLAEQWELVRAGMGYPDTEAVVQDVALVAFPQLEAMAYRGRMVADGSVLVTLAILAVDSDFPPLVVRQHHVSEGPDDPVEIEVLAGPLIDDPSHSELDVFLWGSLPNGGALLGSTFTPATCNDLEPPICGDAKLGNRRLEVYDSQGLQFPIDPTIYTSASAVFDEPRGTEAFVAQELYVHGLALLKEIDALKDGQWDHPPDSAFGEDDPANVALFVNWSNNPGLSCTASASGCFKHRNFEDASEAAKWDALDHGTYEVSPGADEDMPIIISSDNPSNLFHEFGHYLDYYTAWEMNKFDAIPSNCDPVAKMCAGGAQCLPDTGDEAYPLTETIATMMAAVQSKRLYSNLQFDADCSVINLVGWHSDGLGQVPPSENCIEEQGDIRQWSLTRPTEPNPGGVQLGCDSPEGYKQAAVAQAWWSVINGKRCMATVPWSCEDFTLPLAADPADAAIQCFHYALSLENGQWYKQFFENIGVCYACIYGVDVYENYIGAFANHGLLEGNAPPPVCPDICGDGSLSGSEECDGNDFGGQECTDFGFVGGLLDCSQGCAIDTAGCNFCGNDTIDGGEDCDGADLGGATCADFGFDMGDLACDESCSIDTSGCSGGGVSETPPAGYVGCLSPTALEECDELGPVACAALHGTGECLGGPCKLTNPGDVQFALDDPFNLAGEFHPDGNYRDEEGNLYYCLDNNNEEIVCSDNEGWGTCQRCDASDGEFHTKLGCSCSEEDDCLSFNLGDPDMNCFGEDFGVGIGYCWDEVPQWRCAEGQCGMAPWYGEDTMYCEYYATFAHCQPFLNCSGPDSIICADQNLICDCDGVDCPEDLFSDGTCTVQCILEDHCSDEGFSWPPDYSCSNDHCQP